ncbi:ATP-binding cassette domain-containing protein [Paenibacillus sp. FSL H7-0331]|uniref:ATP-binding cassette domain-containing protein n=1 Tax=Paenibacillus sp. FSL H7-0331 TaxID=1920421 RepID=UPI00096E00EA|nr:ATP-binding cassette domain-containing protein [Paenibacillus sp. FSL H7-0331]OME99257.1 hypothetical protein BK127_38860 [Paenibacillus sp. FSL H7-0331]
MILEQLQFQAYAGDMVALLGANGAGKTTFFRSLMQLLPVQTGIIRILGREIHIRRKGNFQFR